MSDWPPPAVAENAAVHRAQALTSETFAVTLAQFRAWLEQIAERPEVESEDGVAFAEAAPAIDLHTMLAQLVALRQEVHLQTRTTRGQQEQNTETLRRLSEALVVLQDERERAPAETPAPDEEMFRPLLKTLLDVSDALGLARREVVRVQDVIGSALEQLATLVALSEPPRPAPLPPTLSPPPLDPEPTPQRSLWARWFGSESATTALTPQVPVASSEPAPAAVSDAAAERTHLAEETAARISRLLDSVLTGYTMSLQRVERTLQQYGLEAIPCEGVAFDPEQMEAVEVATASGRTSGEVVAEIRRGYLWRGRVFRYAQVSVAKG